MTDVREIRLSRGLVALIDAADYESVAAAGNWHARPHGHTVYAQRHVLRADGRRTTQQLHKFLTGWDHTDHINGNGLDNRRANLRPATQTENNGNRRKHGGTSVFKGVDWRRYHERWRAQIRRDGKTRHLGYFTNEEDAARAYDAAARELFGEFARLNFPKESTSV